MINPYAQLTQKDYTKWSAGHGNGIYHFHVGTKEKNMMKLGFGSSNLKKLSFLSSNLKKLSFSSFNPQKTWFPKC